MAKKEKISFTSFSFFLAALGIKPKASQILSKFSHTKPQAQKIFLYKKSIQDGCQWLFPVVLVTWEAEIQRIEVRGQPGQIVLKTSPISKITSTKCVY
jgi:hypothetical protein